MKPRTIAGIMLFLGGIGCYTAGGFVLANGIDRAAVQDEQFIRSERACREQIVRLGSVKNVDGGPVDIEFNDVRDPRRALADATSVLAMCPARNIIDACLGTNCSGGAIGPLKLVVRLSAPRR